jgi:hypothetical protein
MNLNYSWILRGAYEYELQNISRCVGGGGGDKWNHLLIHRKNTLYASMASLNIQQLENNASKNRRTVDWEEILLLGFIKSPLKRHQSHSSPHVNILYCNRNVGISLFYTLFIQKLLKILPFFVSDFYFSIYFFNLYYIFNHFLSLVFFKTIFFHLSFTSFTC